MDNENKIVKSNSSNITIFNTDINVIKSFAEIAINTKLATKIKTVDNKPITVEDVTMVILTGLEFGLKPIQSLQLADKLNTDGYLAITKGAALGVDVTTALDNIHIINTSNGRTPFTGIHLVQSLLLKHKIDTKVLLDFVPLYSYFKYAKVGNENKKIILDINEVEDENYKVRDKYFVYQPGVSNEANVEEAKVKNLNFIMKEQIGFRTAICLNRNGFSPITYCYTTIDAINEGVYPGVDRFGNTIEGQSTWIKYTRSKMFKTAVMRAARIIADDILNGILIDAELDILVANGQINKKDIHIEEATEIEE